MSFSTHRYLLMTVDPVHIGTGGMRLGRVDNSIVREPGTRLPKIPGTSLSGAIRSYAAYRYSKRSCAGKDGHCGRPTCPICYTFGSVAKGDGSDQSFSGVVSIGDARMLLFPVYSMAGPVWVTSPTMLEGFGIEDQNVNDNEAKWNGITTQSHLNLGWMMVKKSDGDWEIPENLKKLPSSVRDRIVLISDKLFSQVVNSNLEVRTSVAINPDTGAAEEGALFTYEAIPRAAFLWMDVVSDDFRGAFPSKEQLKTWKRELEESDKQPKMKIANKWHLLKNNPGDSKLNEVFEKALEWINDDLKHYAKMPNPDNGWKKYTHNPEKDSPQNVITAGLEWAEHLGIGGMGTRGFGRIKNIDFTQLHPTEISCQEEPHAI